MLKEKNKLKIILTGGHALTTAISVVEELQRRSNYLWDLYWIGPENTIEGEKTPTLASIGLPKSVTFRPINAAKLQRKISGMSLISLIKFPIGFVQAYKLVSNIKPDLILSFGGYAAFPVVVIGKLFDIPIMLHDQTYSYNRSNKASAIFADKIAVSRKVSMKYYPEDKTVLTGNPVMSQIFDVQVKLSIGDPPTIYVTGGSSGARAVNNLVLEILPKILKRYCVIHHTGYLDFKKINRVRNKLPSDLRNRYEVYPVINPMQIDGVYARSDIVISRAGANTVSELLIVKRPSILIPLVIGKLKEQVINAEYAHKFGVATVLTQDEITSEDLHSAIESTEKNWNKIVANIKNKKSPDNDAAEKVVNELLILLHEKI